VLSAKTTPNANNAGWNNGPVTVVWSRVDPESGIALVTGCDSTTLTTETPGMTLNCAITNGAGLSSTGSVTVRIDRTPPEAYHQFDPATRTVQMFARDGLSGTAARPGAKSCLPAAWSPDDDENSSRSVLDVDADANRRDRPNAQLCTYTITDFAGNKLILVEKIRQVSRGDDRDEIRVRIVSTQYNNGPVVSAPANQTDTRSSFSKDGTLRSLVQSMAVRQGKNRQQVEAEFDPRRNETTIRIQDSADRGKDVERDKDGVTVKPGLVLLRMITRAGLLDIELYSN
jgi:hypothetical protein